MCAIERTRSNRTVGAALFGSVAIAGALFGCSATAPGEGSPVGGVSGTGGTAAVPAPAGGAPATPPPAPSPEPPVTLDPTGPNEPPPPNPERCKANFTGIVRDFRARGEDGGHPDFQAFWGNNATTGIVEPILGADKKPVYAHDGPAYGESQQTTNAENFNQWYRDTEGVNLSTEFTVPLAPDATGIQTYETPAFFPIDDQLFGNYEGIDATDPPRNFHFTFELHTEFAYKGGEVFTFTGDDDLWVFINNQLAIDLGGLHHQIPESVNLDEIAAEFGLVIGNTYPLDLFHAERRTDGSHFRIDTSIEFTNCDPIIVR